ncbi:stemmadenine O-acetyltransferase-like [Prosopis cineraria]|uniref:stemmadenine O-acetyltransferase-like n=1 Tax=Prosopis cineraria TaxID=364024 RepID=UPI00240EFB27|nr:stemmadenine O-acetyltransferase-like [Prosopis cineraria]
MREVEVEIISAQDIKPSSPTPSHLGTFKLCLLDHLIPAPYAPIIFFFPSLALSEIPRNLHLLKQSLSDTLTVFYPLAGKIKDDFSIHCNDEGANFVEAKVKCLLSEFLTKPDLISLHNLLPCDLKIPKESYVGSHVSNIQVNVFDCGGIAIGLCISHRVLDGASLSSFLKVWTNKARVGCADNDHKEVVKPELLMASSWFPMNDDDGLWLRNSSMAMWGSMFKKGQFETRRFWFSNSAIANLKVQMVDFNSEMVKSPTRLEIVSAILWKSFMDASIAQSDSDCYNNNNTQSRRTCLVSHLVNLRKRMKDKDDDLCSSAENAIGNLLWLAFAKSNVAEDGNNNKETRLDGLLKKLRKAFSTIDDKFVENMRSNHARKSTMLPSLNIKSMIGDDDEDSEVECLGFTSWCNFGFYEVDFGWGKPLWVSSIGSCGSVFMNLVILVDSRFGDGIEAWVTLDERFMGHLEANPELLGYAVLDPSPLAISNKLDYGSPALCKM